MIASLAGRTVALPKAGREGMRLILKLPIAAEDRNGTTRHLALVRLIPLQLKRRGVETRMVLAGEATPSRVELALLKAVARARRWALEMGITEVVSAARSPWQNAYATLLKQAPKKRAR